jgi:hypothetical protein
MAKDGIPRSAGSWQDRHGPAGPTLGLRAEERQMHILRIEHSTSDYDAWKQAFDSDPVGRAQNGVRRHRVARQADDPNFVTVDLELDGANEAEAFLAKLLDLWSRVDVIRDPKARIFELVEVKDS